MSDVAGAEEPQMTEEQKQQEEQRRKDWLAGFNDDAPASIDGEGEGKKPGADGDEPPTEGARAPVAEPEKPEPKYVQITEDEANLWRGGMEKLLKLESSLSGVSGHVGNIKQAFDQLKAGGKVELSDEDLKPFADFPELVAPIKQLFETVGSRQRVIAEPAKIDPAEIDKAVDEKVRQRAYKNLEREYPKWQEIVGWKPGATAPDETVPFRQWMKAQAPEIQEEIRTTNDPDTVRYYIARQRRETAAANRRAREEKERGGKPPASQQQDDRLADAVQPKGDGGKSTVIPPKSYADHFRDGFNRKDL